MQNFASDKIFKFSKFLAGWRAGSTSYFLVFPNPVKKNEFFFLPGMLITEELFL